MVKNSTTGPSLYNIYAGPDGGEIGTLQISCEDGIKQLSAGKTHVALLSERGQVYTFGIGSRGELGHGYLGSEQFPVLIETLEPVRIIQIASAFWHNVALTEQGDVYVWGWNCCGQFGGQVSESEIVDTPLPLEIDDSIQSVGAFRGAVFLKDSHDKVVCFGTVGYLCH